MYGKRRAKISVILLFFEVSFTYYTCLSHVMGRSLQQNMLGRKIVRYAQFNYAPHEKSGIKDFVFEGTKKGLTLLLKSHYL